MGSFTKHIRPMLNLVQGRPILAIFEINLRCNSNCGYCDLPLNKGRYEMSRTEIRDIFTKLYKTGLRYVFVQGGEPTLRKDLPEILEDLHDIGLKLSLISNGTHLTETFIERLSQLPVDLSISLDSLDRHRYKEIRGADQLNLVLAGLQGLSRYPHPKYITCIVSEKNRAEVMEIVRYAHDRGFIAVVGAYHWDVDRYGKADPRLQYKNTDAVKVFEQVLQSDLVPRGYFRNYLRDNIEWLSGNGLKRCDAGRHSIAIDASGNVSPCLALQQVGNLREISLANILNRFDKVNIKQCSDKSSCNMMCSRVIGSTLRRPLNALLTPDHLPARKLT